MVAEQFSSFKGSGQFRQRDETAGFGESVNYGEYGGVALRVGQIGDEVNCYMRPRSTWCGKWV